MAFSLDHPALVIITSYRPFSSFHSSVRVFAVVAACCAGGTGSAKVAGLICFLDADVAALFSSVYCVHMHSTTGKSFVLFSVVSMPLLLNASVPSLSGAFALGCLRAFRAPTGVSPLLFYVLLVSLSVVSVPLLMGAHVPFTLPLVSPLLFRSFRSRLPPCLSRSVASVPFALPPV